MRKVDEEIEEAETRKRSTVNKTDRDMIVIKGQKEGRRKGTGRKEGGMDVG